MHARFERPSGRVPLVAAGVAGAALVALALGAGYMMLWRDIPLEVNGEAVEVKVGTHLDDYLAACDYQGQAAGRLLSLSGAVLDEDGGERATVVLNGDAVASDAWDETRLDEGDSLEVTAGADVTEGHTEDEAAIAPSLEWRGSGAIQYVEQWGRAGRKLVWCGKVSGETVDHEVLEEATPLVVSSRNPRPADGKKYMALTFDDGPSSYTEKLLDILKEKGAKATFFNLGNQEQSHADAARAVVEAGCEIASHTYSHKNLPTCDRDTLRNEISGALDATEEATGARTQMIRAPYGAFTATEWSRAADLISCNVLWNIDTLDWKRPGADAIVGSVVSGAHNGAIVLMHDGGGNREQDVEALPRIIDELRERGFELVTVSELMKLDGGFPADVVAGAVSMPEDAALPDA